MKIYNKLVRDNIEEIMISKGAKPVTRILSDEEYLTELNKKLLEEVNEYLESEDIEELAEKQISNDNLEEIRLNKVKKRGAFKKRLFLEKEL